jgi:hypothetical protein
VQINDLLSGLALTLIGWTVTCHSRPSLHCRLQCNKHGRLRGSRRCYADDDSTLLGKGGYKHGLMLAQS